MLIVNADDYGLNRETTDRILTCYKRRRITCASAMTFMADSERAALLSRETGLRVGLHLNLDEELTGPKVPVKLKHFQRATAAYLNARKWNQILYNPFLNKSFSYIFQSQWDEFVRLYGEKPERLDGHHHWHLCMNVLLCGKIPQGIQIRRNFTFHAGEKNRLNRLYRYLVDLWLQRKYACTSAFFSMTPINQGPLPREKLRRPIMLSAFSEVEVVFHPGNEHDFNFLLSPEWEQMISEANRK